MENNLVLLANLFIQLIDASLFLGFQENRILEITQSPQESPFPVHVSHVITRTMPHDDRDHRTIHFRIHDCDSR